MPPKKISITISSKAPAGWQRLYNALVDVRSTFPVTPVDVIGCTRLSRSKPGTEEWRFQNLVSLMLSSQTKDQKTAEGVHNLTTRLPGGCTAPAVAKASTEQLDKLISMVGFHSQKAKYLKNSAQLILDCYDGCVPRKLSDVLKLPGVGPKMAHLFLQCSDGNSLTGIGVDVHVHRIVTERWQWVKRGKALTDPKSTTPEEARAALEAWLPKQHWSDINELMVGFGQTVCVPVGPRCHICPAQHFCPSSSVKKTGNTLLTATECLPAALELFAKKPWPLPEHMVASGTSEAKQADKKGKFVVDLSARPKPDRPWQLATGDIEDLLADPQPKRNGRSKRERMADDDDEKEKSKKIDEKVLNLLDICTAKKKKGRSN